MNMPFLNVFFFFKCFILALNVYCHTKVTRIFMNMSINTIQPSIVLMQCSYYLQNDLEVGASVSSSSVNRGSCILAHSALMGCFYIYYQFEVYVVSFDYRFKKSAMSSLPRFGQMVVGPPGSGKSTYCKAMKEFLTTMGKSICSTQYKLLLSM